MGKSIGKKERPVLQYSLTGELINEYKSLTEASKKVSRANVQCIWLCCNGRAGTHADYIWKYKPTEIVYKQVRKNMPKTMSKNFYDHEIRGILEIDGRKVIYLKDKVVRKRYFDFSDDNYVEHINQQLIHAQKLEKFYKEIMGTDDFENN